MADPSKIGTHWQAAELDAIVADYFQMLLLDLAGNRYVKSHHSKTLMAQIGRTHRSIEFKHQNISAVLDELGLPWIPGYIPKRNYQQAIFPAIDRYLTSHPAIFEFLPSSPPGLPDPEQVFVPRPAPSAHTPPPLLAALVNKFDPVERDQRNRQLGRMGESFVVEIEKRCLAHAGRPDLANQIRWISAEQGDGAGYDVLSYDPHRGHERLIEVKTTNGSARTPFFLTRNEFEVSRRRPGHWLLYRVHHFAKNARIFTLPTPIDHHVTLQPELCRGVI